MDFLTASPFSRPPISSAVAGLVSGGGGQEASSTASELVERIVVGIITCAFALVGTPIGAVTGAFIGLATETGLFRGAGIGAIYGAVFSVEAVESSVALWHSHESGVSSILYVIDIICSLLTGRLVREKVGPAVQSAVQSQMSALELPYVEALDIFETGDTRGMSKDSVELLPILKITSENSCDCSGERIICSVCLQDIQIGETVRSLPFCKHMFHLRCIDSWLVRNGSCPLCRRDI
ncbi:NEP1-interacting protein 1 [Platanthera zijinensis]|uniref:NEP1-interacting protein 1 n=1 Tax=Platanthera zijinensis TaxID=2320716 RepID=A0AAP0FVG7_9ASPA